MAPIWIKETDVVQLVSLADALAALERGLAAEGRDEAWNIPKALGRWPAGGAMHCLGAMMPSAGYVGWKTWAVTPRGGAVTYQLFSADSGSLLAVIEGSALGQMRTAAMTGLGTKWLAAPEADTLGLVGTGRQALAQVAAIHAVRPLREVLVHSRDPEKRAAFARLIEDSVGVTARPVATVAATVGEVAIATLVTRADEPFLDATMLARGAHLNAVGAILRSNAEFSQDVFGRVTAIAVDNIDNVRLNSREFNEQFGDGDWSKVETLGRVIAAGEGRPADADLTLFKSMGMGLSDLAVAIEIYSRAVAGGSGLPLGAIAEPVVRWS